MQTLALASSAATQQAGSTYGLLPRDSRALNLYGMRIDDLRRAVHDNQVSFPSQVPTFPKHDRPDLQRKLVQLYFVRGWSCQRIATRYRLQRLRIVQILNSWKKRAVDVGYIQLVPSTAYLPPARHSPIHLILRPVLNDSLGSVRPAIADMASRAEKSPRPRSRFSAPEVARVVQQLLSGRKVSEMAEELGVSPSTIRNWRERRELRSLRSENGQLKKQLDILHAIEEVLIDPITRSDSVREPAFMPFSQVSPHTESDYCDSL